MDDKHLNIDDWLKKAAAQQPAPDDAGQDLKRQAWSKMAALLDEEEVSKPQPRLFRFRLNWAAIIIPFVATAAVFAASVWVAPRFFSEKPAIVKTPSVKTNRQQQGSLQQAAADSTAGINATQHSIPVDTITGIAGKTAATPDNEPGSIPPALPLPLSPNATAGNKNNPAAATPDNSINTGNNSSAAGNAGGTLKAGNNNKTGNNVNGSTAVNADAPANSAGAVNNKPFKPLLQPGMAAGKPGAKGAAVTGKERRLPHNKVNKAAASGTVNDNEAIASEQTATPVRERTGLSGNNTTSKGLNDTRQASVDAGNTPVILYPVVTKNPFALQLPSLSSDSHSPRIAEALSGRLISLVAPVSNWSLQAGLLSPFSSALGIRLGALYVHPLRGGWYLQPQVSVSYLTGYDKAFSHLSIVQSLRDSSGSGGTPRYNVDSTFTPYTFKRSLAGSVGINAGYRKNRLSVSTGLVYSMAVASGKTDSASKRSNVIYDSTGVQNPFTDPAFSAGRLPGKHQVSWNVDVSWYVLPRLQAGFNYRVALWRSNGDKGFQAPLQRIQDNSLLELYIRIPIGK